MMPKSLAFLLTRYGRFLGTDDYDDFQGPQLRRHLLRTPLVTFYEQPEPLTINYDGGIALQGTCPRPRRRAAPVWTTAQLGTGALSVGGLAMADRARSWIWIMRSPCACTILRAKGHTRKMLSCGTRSHWPTSYWSASASGRQPGSCSDFPADLQPGDYELRLVVYDFLTQTPTVQQDVWLGEITPGAPATGGSPVKGASSEKRVEKKKGHVTLL